MSHFQLSRTPPQRSYAKAYRLPTYSTDLLYQLLTLPTYSANLLSPNAVVEHWPSMGPALQSTEIAPETAPSMPSEIPSEITSEIPSERHRLRQEGGTLWLVATEEIAAGQVGLQLFVVEAATVCSGGCNHM